jgi:nitroimidazol reductase NimA-like FMN-containing flavoprotein (pyridoxamine 5'-phosphate oxidase superfamily)
MYEILDSTVLCHIGYVENGVPFVLPYGYARDGDHLLIHGSSGARFMRAMADGATVCVTVTKLDGIVLARSTFDSSMNYRSVMVIGVAEQIEGPEKARLLDVLSDGLIPGRVAEVRSSAKKELAATILLRLPLTEASVKVRAGGVDEDVDGYQDEAAFNSVWAGVIPLATVAGAPIPADSAAAELELPPSVTAYLQNPKA